MRKAISYIRMSSEQQLKGNSLARQLELTKNYAQQHDLELLDNLQDLGLSAYSGKHTKSGELGRFLQAIEDNEIDAKTVLLVESLDRLSRQKPVTAFTQLTKILEYGIEIHTIFDGQIYTSESLSSNHGQLFISIGSMMRAYDESRTKSERLKKSWAHKRKNLSHKILTRNVPAWLEFDEKKQTIRLLPDMAKAVRQIFKLSIEENKGSFSITRYLNENLDKFPKTTNVIRNNKKQSTWGESYIKKILSNPAVYGAFQPHSDVNGKRVPDGEPVADYFPAVITKAEFLLAQDRMAQRRVNGSGRRGKTFSNIFTQLLVCGCCGANIVYKDKGKAPKGGKYLGCRKSDEGTCTSPNWKYEEFENAFLLFITELSLEDVFTNSNLKKHKQKIETDLASLKHELNSGQNQFDNLVNRLSSIDETLVSDIEKKLLSTKEKNNHVKEEINKKEIELASIENRNTKKAQQGIIRGIKEFKETKTIEEIKLLRQRISALIRTVVETVIIHNSFIKIEPWETDLLHPVFIKNFDESRTRRTEHKTIEEFIQSDFGQREWVKFQRYFTVKFKNGTVKRIQPALNINIYTKSLKMVEFLKRIKQD